GLGYACALLVRDDDGGFDLDELPDSFDCLVDRGAFGIEPGVYLVGADALDVAHKAIALHGVLERGDTADACAL
ncbi:MAG: hypothetical protein KO463_00850, partial [Candidatus Methanofastidiosa archaeon]|nr:hypothetical protein [Candidatus Methanofastidiosa archaeon]